MLANYSSCYFNSLDNALNFKALNGLAPSYLSDLVKFYVLERDLGHLLRNC